MRVYHMYSLCLEESGAPLTTLCHKCQRGHIAQTAVRPVVIIIHPPANRKQITQNFNNIMPFEAFGNIQGQTVKEDK